MISFTDITESTYHIQGTSKQKETTQRMLNFLRKKDSTETCLLQIWKKKSIL